MSNNAKNEQAMALIAALQTILDKLPDSADPIDDTEAVEEEARPARDPTHQLFVGAMDQSGLAGLFTSIRIIHTIHNANR